MSLTSLFLSALLATSVPVAKASAPPPFFPAPDQIALPDEKDELDDLAKAFVDTKGNAHALLGKLDPILGRLASRHR